MVSMITKRGANHITFSLTKERTVAVTPTTAAAEVKIGSTIGPF